jgi:hypothetical protein
MRKRSHTIPGKKRAHSSHSQHYLNEILRMFYDPGDDRSHMVGNEVKTELMPTSGPCRNRQAFRTSVRRPQAPYAIWGSTLSSGRKVGRPVEIVGRLLF